MPSIDATGFETEGFRLLCEFGSYENFPGIPAEAMERIHRIMVQAQGGQTTRPRVMFKFMESVLDHEPTEDQVREVYVLGWVVELLQFAILTADDIVDQDTWRRGRWAWHRQPGVGLGAVYDSFVGAFLALAFLKKHLENHPSYIQMVELINRQLFQVQLFQSWEHMIASQGPGNVSTFCTHKLRDISLGISGYFYLPVALILQYLQLDTTGNMKTSRFITDELAVYYQSQNDYLDLYGTRAQNGKNGKDIRQNKCSWLIVEALKKCSDIQRNTLEENYGRDNEECAEKVKAIFEELDMPEVFQTYKRSAVAHIEALINSVDESDGLSKEAFSYYLSILVVI